jgi:2'-5' RNA ligase
MRTFIAIELEHAIKRPLIRLLREELPRSRDVRWCAENQLHLTLKFLGEVSDTLLPKVCGAAAEASAEVEPFSLRISGLGCFPGPRNPRVMWCGVEDPTGGCRKWVERADPLLEELNFKRETRAFTPHITLGRSRNSSGARVIQEALEDVEPPETDEMLVQQVIVFESRLLPGGAQYKPLATVPLGVEARGRTR